jgi:hypothetical protein
MVPTRRRLLQGAAAGTAALAGCSVLGDGCTHRISLRLEPSTVESIVQRDTRTPEEMHPVGARLVRRAHENGSATYRSVADPPVPTYVYVPLDGQYHAVAMEPVAKTTVTGHEFDVEMDAGTTPEPDASAIAFEDLQAHDRRAFLAALGFPHPRKLEGMSGNPTVAFAERSLVDASVLVPEPQYDYVQYRGNYYRLAKTGTGEATVRTYEVTLEAVADSDAALAAEVRATHGVVLRSEALSARQREILDEALGGYYSECDEFSEALQGLRDRLRAATYAKYEGAWYRVRLSKMVA